MYALLLVLVLQILVLRSTATCPGQCRCQTRESEFVRQTSGVVLNCSHTGLTDAHITDKYGSKVLHLELSSNAITRLGNDAFPSSVFSVVQQINLSNNTIVSVDVAAFSGLSELRSLSLGYNNLTALPAGVFDNNTQMAFLDLKANARLQLPARGYNVSSLVWLDLSDCGLEVIPPAFFDSTRNLQFVYLSHNRLTQVAPQALRAISGSVRYLDVYANQFTRLQPELLQVLPASCKLFLYDNPFHCDCNFLKAYSVYKRRPYVTVLGCRTPESLRRTRPDELDTVLKCD